MVFQWRLALPSQGRRLVGSVPDSLIWSVWILRVLPIDIADGGCWKKEVFRMDGWMMRGHSSDSDMTTCSTTVDDVLQLH